MKKIYSADVCYDLAHYHSDKAIIAHHNGDAAGSGYHSRESFHWSTLAVLCS